MNRSQCPQLWLVEAIRDGRVVGAERAVFEKHRSICRACAEYSEAARALQNRLSELPSGLPDAFTIRRQRRELLRTLDASLVGATSRHRTHAVRVAILAAAAAGALAFSYLHRRPAVPPSWVEVVAGPGAAWSEEKTNVVDRVALLNGRFHLSIRRPSPSSRVLLTLPDGEIEDLGTVLDVWTEGERTRHVGVQSGEIIMRLRGLPEVRLDAGDEWDRPSSVEHESPPHAELTPDANGTHEASPRLIAAQPNQPAKGRDLKPHAVSARSGNLLAQTRQEPQPPPEARSAPDAAAEDVAYLRVLDLFEAGRRDDARGAVREYLAQYPRGFRHLEVLGIERRLEHPAQ